MKFILFFYFSLLGLSSLQGFDGNIFSDSKVEFLIDFTISRTAGDPELSVKNAKFLGEQQEAELALLKFRKILKKGVFGPSAAGASGRKIFILGVVNKRDFGVEVRDTCQASVNEKGLAMLSFHGRKEEVCYKKLVAWIIKENKYKWEKIATLHEEN